MYGGGGLVAQSHLTLETPWTVAHRAPLSVEFSRQEFWSGLPFPPPRDLPHPGVKPAALESSALAGGFSSLHHQTSPVLLLNSELTSPFPMSGFSCQVFWKMKSLDEEGFQISSSCNILSSSSWSFWNCAFRNQVTFCWLVERQRSLENVTACGLSLQWNRGLETVLWFPAYHGPLLEMAVYGNILEAGGSQCCVVIKRTYFGDK